MQDAVKLAAQYGIGGILALVLGFVIYKIGMRMIAAIDEMRKSNAASGQATVEALADLSKEVQLAIADAQVAQASSIADLSERIARVELVVGVSEPKQRGPFEDSPTPIEKPRTQTTYSVVRRAHTGGKP